MPGDMTWGPIGCWNRGSTFSLRDAFSKCPICDAGGSRRENREHVIYRVGQKISYCTFSISSLNIDQFLHFLPVDSGKNLLLSGMYTTLIMSLHYLVKYKYSKMYNIYRW